MLLVLQLAETLAALKLTPVTALVNSVPFLTCAQVLQRVFHTGGSLRIFSGGRIDALTKDLLNF